MSVYKRGGIYWCCFSINGKSYRRSTKQRSQKAAEKVEQEMLKSAEQSKAVVAVLKATSHLAEEDWAAKLHCTSCAAISLRKLFLKYKHSFCTVHWLDPIHCRDYAGWMNRIFGTLLFIGLAGIVWNIFAWIVSWFGVVLPGIDPGIVR